MNEYYRCTKLKGQPEMNLSMCIGRWNAAQGKKGSQCKNCTIFFEQVAELARKVMVRR